MLRVPVFLCLLACGVCDSSPVRHRRPIKGFVNDQSNLLDKRAVHGWRTNGDPQQRLLDLSGVYRGTWTKLQDPHHSSSSNSVDPLPVLLHSGSGPLLLHLTTGPRHPHEDTAAVQGVLQLSQGSLSVGRSLQEQLTLSGLTRLNKHENVQEIHALLQSQYTLGSQQNTGTSSSSSMQEGDQQPPASLAHWIRHKQQRRQQQQQRMKLPPTKHQIWLRGRRGPGVTVSPRGPRTRFQGPLTSGTAGGTAVEALGPGPDFDTDIDTDTDSNTNTAVGADKEHSSSSSSSSADWDGPHRSLSFSESGTSGVKCRFRLQLAVTASAQQQVAAAAAVLRDLRGGRSMKAARDQDLNDVEDLDDVEDLEGSIKDQQQQQLDVGDGETAVDDVGSSSEIMSLYRLRQQHAVGLMQVLKQQQQQQHVVLDRSGSGDLRMKSVDKYDDGMRDEKMQQQLIAAAAAAVINQGYDSSAAAPHTHHPQLPPLDQIEVLEAEALAAGTDSSSSNGGGQHTLRALHSRSFPGFVELGNDIDTHEVKKDQAAAAAADQNLAMQDRKLISDDHDDQDAESSSQSQPTAAAAAAVYSSIGPETRQAPQSLIDYWVLPCSHPQQQHTPRCWQQRQQQQRLMIQGLLLSDNCNASWSLTAVALPPGGLEHQATCYAVGALLLCVLQVIALRRQARAAAISPAAALKVSLLGVCGGAQLDACLSMAHLAAALAAADVSVPLLVVAAAQFAIFAGADMTLMLHVWRAHHSSSRRQRQQRQQQQQQVFGTAATAAAAAGGLVLETELVAAPLLQVGWSRSWTTAMAAVAAAAAAHLQEQADGLRGFMHSSSGSSLIDALLSGLVQLLTGQSLLLLYIRFYLVLLAVVVISWLLVSQLPLLLLLAFSMWLPQLLHNIQHSTKQALLPAYIVAATAARIMLPLYLLSCPSNMLQTTPQPLLAGGLLVWVGFQVLLLLLQHCCGPHVLLPHSWTPERYNYHRIELPWQFKQQLAEMRKLEQWQQQQHGTEDTAAAAAAAAASGSSSLGVVACQCHCDQFVTGAGRTVWDLHNRQAAAVDSWQQHWCLAAAAAAGSGTCCCRCRCVHDQSITTAFSPTSARPLYRVSSSSSSNYWQSCGSNALVPATQQQQQQHHAARFSWAAGCTDSSSTQQRLGSGGYCSDACYISMLGAAAAAALAAPAASSTLHEPQRQQQRHSSTPYSNMMHNLTQQQQQQRCCCHSYCPHQQPATTAVVSPPDSYNTTQNAAASSSSSILAPLGCVSSPQAWPDCQASSEDSLLHDVVESYDAVSGQGFVECVICMAAVSLLPAAGRCVTPCGHFFHTECLASWIEVKAECPTCRGPLPPLG